MTLLEAITLRISKKGLRKFCSRYRLYFNGSEIVVRCLDETRSCIVYNGVMRYFYCPLRRYKRMELSL
jgi:hypothetical protein